MIQTFKTAPTAMQLHHRIGKKESQKIQSSVL